MLNLTRNVLKKVLNQCDKCCSSTYYLALRSQSSKGHVIESRVPEVKIPEVLIHEFIWNKLDKWHDRTALLCLESGRNYTYHEVHKKSRALSVFLKKKVGLKAGDVVGFVSRNVPEYVIGMIACYQAGLIPTTMNPIYTSEEIKRQLLDSNAKLVFTLSKLYPLVKEAIKGSSTIPIAVIKHEPDEDHPSGAIKFSEMCEGDHRHFDWDCPKWEDVAILPYSSGTTGLPKGVQLTHKSVVSNLCQWLHSDIGLFREASGSHQDVIPCYLPMYHIYGIATITMTTLSMGSKMVIIPKFSSKMLLKLLETNKPDILFAVPPVVLMLLNNNNFKMKHFENIRHVISSAAPLGIADIERFLDKTKGKTDFMQLYGMTEASPLVLSQTNNYKGGVKIGGSGILVPNTIAKIVDVNDPDDTGLGPLRSGELIIKGPQIMKGYHKREEETNKTIVNGWLRTGDIAHFDEDGQFFITDRLKELIKVKGLQVAPAELEELLRNHPAVADAAVVGVSHPELGEAPKAFIVPKKDVSLNVDHIHEYVSSKVAKYKHLTGGVTVMEEIPKTPSGKILRRQLKVL